MKYRFSIPILSVTLFLAGCASSPSQSTSIHSQQEVLQKMREMQTEQQPQQARIDTGVRESIIPDLDEEGRRSDMARKVQAEASALFLQADANRDYQLSVDEINQYYPFVSRNFDRFDQNRDNQISWQELLRHDKWPMPVHDGSPR